MTGMTLPMLIDHRAEPVPVTDTPRIQVVAPGPHYSTKDVYDGAIAGLRALGTVDVLGLDYHFDLMVAGRIEGELEGDEAARFGNLTSYASHRAVAMAMAFRPDLILFISGTIFPPAVAAMLGQYTQTAVWLTESPYQDEGEYAVQSFYKYAFTNERLMVDRIVAKRIEDGHPYPGAVHYLPHGFDPLRHYPRTDVPDEYRSDVCFIGSPFPERQALLSGVDWTGIDFVSRGVWSTRSLEDTLHTLPDNVPNEEAQLYYAGAKINLNHHRLVKWYGFDAEIAPDEADSLNPRVYELAAGKCFQICDDSRDELRDIFGNSIPTYSHRDPADLERVIRYYLAHPEERERCAQEAYERVQSHTVAARMRVVLDTCLADM
jgi:spore maturation protein CgeB